MTTPRLTDLNWYAFQAHRNSREHGFWPRPVEEMFSEKIALMHSELSEALEEHRDGRPVHYVPVHQQGCTFSGEGLTPSTTEPCGDPACKPEGAAVELADALIRVLDTMYALGVDVDGVVREKMAYNANRPHMHGKAY